MNRWKLGLLLVAACLITGCASNMKDGITFLEENKYEEVIAKYTDTQLVYEQAILNEEETILYNKKKALKEEFKKRVRGEK